ncbi:MAG: hypothetical protein R6U65_03615, partial [Perlabentimonas sp.]
MKIVGQLKAILGLDKSRYEKGLKGAKKSTNKFGNSLKKIGGIMAGAFAVGKIVSFGKKVVEAANIQAQAEQKLASQIAANGKAVKSTMADYTAFASQMQKVTTVGDETTLSLLQMAETMQSPAPKDAAKGAIALSKSLGVDLQSALKMVTLAQQGEYTMLNRYVPSLRAASTETEKAAILQKTLADGFEIAKTEAQTGSGAITQMQNALGDVSEEIGNALLPVLVNMANKIKTMAEWVQDNKEQVLKWAKGIGYAVGALGAAKVAMVALNIAMKANPIGLIITGLSLLVSGLVAAWKKSEKFRAVVKYVAQSVAGFFKRAAIIIPAEFKIMVEKIKGFFKSVAGNAKVLWATIKAVFQKGKNPADVWREGFANLGKEMSDIGGDIRKEMNAELDKIKTPSYEEILAKEQAKTAAKKAGKEAGKEFSKGFASGASGTGGGGGTQKIDSPDKIEPITPAIDVEKVSAQMAAINDVVAEKTAETVSIMDEYMAGYYNDLFAKASETFGSIGQLMQGVSDLYRAQKDSEIAAAENAAKQQGKSEQWLSKKKAEINKKYAKKEKNLAIAMAIINTAQGVTKALAQGGVVG